MSRPAILFACSRCFARHPFEELSSGQQLCKGCHNTTPVVKCTYCRIEYQQMHKTQTSCKKCEYNLKNYGKPKACSYCNLVAAFVGNKCQRCTSSETKYGPPRNCEQCKQKSAFDRSDAMKKNDAKLLCWLCGLSYKRAVEKTKQIDGDKKSKQKESQNNENNNSKSNKRSFNKMVDDEKSLSPSLGFNLPPTLKGHKDDFHDTEPGAFSKFPRNNSIKSELDLNNTENFVTINQLKEKINLLQKQLSQKDQQLLAKDRQITELKAKHFTIETELRNKMKQVEREYEQKVEQFNSQIQNLMKKVATLSKSSKRGSAENKSALSVTRDNNSGSGTDSPSFN